MNAALITLVKDIHYSLDQTRIFSIHTHRPFYDKNGVLGFLNMGTDNQIAKDRINKLIGDFGKMKDYVNRCKKKLGQDILGNNVPISILNQLNNLDKHLKNNHGEQNKFGDYVLGKITVTQESDANSGIITAMDSKKTSFWDISDGGYACILINADILDKEGGRHNDVVSLAKESLKIWERELKNNSIDIPEYVDPDPFVEAEKYGQHDSLFVESYEDARIKGSILTSEKKYSLAAVLYNYALTKSKTDEERALCYGCLGLSYEDEKEFIMAQASYWTALRLNPTQSGLHVNFGNMCDLLGDKATAKLFYMKELELHL